MINNRQVNIWRGTKEPPTIYHVWIFDDLTIKLHNGTEWVTFIDNFEVIDKINQILESIETLENFMDNSTINGYKVKTNPVLNGLDLEVKKKGSFIEENENVTNAIMTLDELFRTQIIE